MAWRHALAFYVRRGSASWERRMSFGKRVRRRVVLRGALALGLAACGGRGGAEVRGPALLFFYTDG
jgi:hypothetical protein